MLRSYASFLPLRSAKLKQVWLCAHSFVSSRFSSNHFSAKSPKSQVCYDEFVFLNWVECIYNFRKEADGYTWGEITVSDSTKRSASYWHSTFLELEECISDKQNTINAYSQIKKNILIPIKKDHKPDFFALYNATIRYMRSVGTFDLDYYKNEIIGSYIPFDGSLDINDLKNKVEKLQRSGKFDATFNKVPASITDKVKEVIKLTDELDLNIRHNFAGMENVILKAELDDGRKGITIVSSDGYDFAKGLERQ